MAIEKMVLVNIVGNPAELDATLKRCCESDCFHIESASQIERNGDKVSSEAPAVIDLQKYAVPEDECFSLNGFVPERESERFAATFVGLKSVRCTLRPQDADPALKPPVKLKNNWFTKPFSLFVEMYGLPSPTDIDPTPIVAVTYTLLFGIMFGDLGQGIVIALVGWLLARFKKMEYGRILIRTGISSAAFGVIYGSVFGYEELLDPFYRRLLHLHEKPIEVMEDVTLLLLASIGLGAVLILFSISVNIILGLRQKNYERAFFGPNGLAGLVLYGSIAVAVVLMLGGINIFSPLFVTLCIILPLSLMFLRKPLAKLCRKEKLTKPEDGIGGFILQNFFKLFEFLLSYITNTMSFLRIGGFMLSHTGMMTVIMLLSESVGPIGRPIVVILGNLFVILLEGMIVGIQALRLEFYEIFSRFYEGEGRPFTPLAPDSVIKK